LVPSDSGGRRHDRECFDLARGAQPAHALAIYLAVAIAVSIAARTFMQSWNVFTLLDAIPVSLLNIATFMAFWVYMRDGRRPNLYFFGRVRAS
jgi:hypothetical protein